MAKIRIYSRKVDKEMPDEDFSRLLDTLCCDRREKTSKLKNPSSARESLVAGLLFQEVVQKELKLSAGDIRILRNKNGKPSIEGYNDFFYNISHSGDMVVMAAGDTELGIDIEGLRQRAADDKVAQRCFSERELKYYHGAKDKTEAFFEIWTMKEAYLKFLGCGISVPLNEFGVDPIERKTEYSRIGVCDRVQFEVKKSDGYIMSLCYENQLDKATTIMYNS